MVHLGFFVDYFFRRAAQGVRIRAEVVVVLVGVVFDDDGAAVLCVVEQALGGGGERGARGVGTDAEHNCVVLG